MSRGVHTNDARYFNYDVKENLELPFKFFLKASRKDEFYQAIHIDWSTKDPVFCSGEGCIEVKRALAPDRMSSYISLYSSLISKKLPILVYFGQEDMRDGARQ